MSLNQTSLLPQFIRLCGLGIKNMNYCLINAVLRKSVFLLIVLAALLNIAFSQRNFDVTEIQPPADASSINVYSLNDNGEAVGSGTFNRCVTTGGGGDISIKDKNSKLDVVCFNEIKPVYWSEATGSRTLGLPIISSRGNKILGTAGQINNSGIIVGRALNQQPYNGGIYPEYLSGVVWGNSGDLSSWLAAPSIENKYSLQVLVSGINSSSQILGARCVLGYIGATECDYHYRLRYFLNGGWITPEYALSQRFDEWRLLSNLNDRGEAIFYHYIDAAATFDIVLFNSSGFHSIKAQLKNPNDSADYSYRLANNGDIFYRDIFGEGKSFWIRKPLENNPASRIEVNTNGVNLSDFNNSEQFIGYDTNLQEYVLWNEVSGSIKIKLPENSGWTIDTTFDINNNGEILAKGTKNGIEKYLLLTPKPPPPLIFVPGTMGSELYRRSDHQKYWISAFSGSLLGYNKYMTLDSSSSYYLGDDAFSAKDALRTVNIAGQTLTTIYDPLIENLKQYGGYKEYELYPSLWALPPPSEGGCDRSQINTFDASKNPTLFIFPYDYRKDNAVSAEKLATFVKCVQEFYPNTPINLLGHSQGGLVSRRYIIDYPTDHGIGKLITIATPYLGAPEAVYKMETGGRWVGDGWGEFIKKPFNDTTRFTVAAITPSQLKFLAKHFKSVHQLLPSRAYYEINSGISGLTEIGDVDGNGVSDEFYDYDKLVNFMNNDFSTNSGTTGKAFHDCLPENITKCQDDWREDTSGVQYTHMIGQQLRNKTTIYVEVKNEVVIVYPLGTHTSQRVFEPVKGPGDGTVPEISASRTNRNDKDFNAPGATYFTFFSDRESLDPIYEHNGLTQNKQVLKYVLFRLGLALDPDAMPFSTAKNKKDSVGKVLTGNSYLPVVTESNYTKIVGISDVEMSDDQGNKTTRDGDIFINKVEGLDYEIIGDNALFLTFPITKTYFAKFQTLNTPFSLDIVKGISNKTPNSAVRYKDVSLPQGTAVQLKVTALNEVVLKYDSNGDGEYDTIIPPTATASGTSANDTTPPKVNIATTMFGTQATVSITANDAETGIKQIMYSINGQGFNIYTSPFTLNVSSPTTVLAVADNNVGIRSGVYRKSILIPTAATSSISGRVINARGSARTVITLTRVSTGESIFTRPNQLGYYRFEDLISGEEYILTPSRKSYRFEPQNRLVSLTEDLDNIDFQATLGEQ
jgi:pimeloyl-ACP methyl ester carboxylesterase